MKLSDIVSSFFTVVPVDECLTDDDCTSNPALTVCDTSSTPNTCIGKYSGSIFKSDVFLRLSKINNKNVWAINKM